MCKVASAILDIGWIGEYLNRFTVQKLYIFSQISRWGEVIHPPSGTSLQGAGIIQYVTSIPVQLCQSSKL
jgi:hypothetical protein